ncbi:MAG: hypothetical protein DMG70_26775 [Acidobacteria bacterium]|nr:MAG: hypothetical protein DMG70_26775 [Acidobacteriota bacterium]
MWEQLNWFWTRQKFDSPPAGPNGSVLSTDGARLLAGLNGHAAHQLNPYRVSVTDHGGDSAGVLDSASAINTAAARREPLACAYGVVGMNTIGAI